MAYATSLLQEQWSRTTTVRCCAILEAYLEKVGGESAELEELMFF